MQRKVTVDLSGVDVKFEVNLLSQELENAFLLLGRRETLVQTVIAAIVGVFHYHFALAVG